MILQQDSLPSTFLISDYSIETTLRDIERRLMWTGSPLKIDWPIWEQDDDSLAWAVVDDMEIHLDIQTWHKLTPMNRFELLCHEACHIIDYWTFYWPQRLSYSKRNYHGPLWRYLMKQLGFKKTKPYLEID